MGKESYLDLRAEGLKHESKRRAVANEIHTDCVRAIKDFGDFDNEFVDSRLNLPVVDWSNNKSDLLQLIPRGEDDESLTAKSLEDVEEELYWSKVESVQVVYYPKEVNTKEDIVITVATIHLYGGPDNSTLVTDFKGDLLSLKELKGLRNDVKRYCKLLKQGQLE